VTLQKETGDYGLADVLGFIAVWIETIELLSKPTTRKFWDELKKRFPAEFASGENDEKR
jgi:hypothetical protein